MRTQELVTCLLVVFILLLVIAGIAIAAESAIATTVGGYPSRDGGAYWQLESYGGNPTKDGSAHWQLESYGGADADTGAAASTSSTGSATTMGTASTGGAAAARARCCRTGGGMHDWARKDLHERGAASGMLLAAGAHETSSIDTLGGDLSLPKTNEVPDSSWSNFRDYGTSYNVSSENLETKKQAKRKQAKRPWQSYETWDALKRDPGASADYFELRTAALNNPEFDWSRVYQSVLPLLDENREYVGVIGIEADGYTLKLLASEASPDAVGEGVSSTYFAGVPAELVAKYAERPALFFFHTHPADERASPLPSSPDLATAIYFAATARFAASAVISRFGVLVYGLAWPAYKSINSAQDWKLALLSYTHDVVASHEAIRSWAWHTLGDYIAFYARMRLIFFSHPSPAMVALSMHAPIMHSLESEVDHEIIDEYSADIAKHIAGKKRRNRRGFKAAIAPGASQDHIWTHDSDISLKLD